MVLFIIKANQFDRMEHVSNVFAMKDLKHKIWIFIYRIVNENSVESEPMVQNMII